jgi:hypothetical protein
VGEGGAQSAPGEGSASRCCELCKQVFHNSASALQNVVIPIAENLKSFSGQDGIASFISFGIQVLAAVDLNDESMLEAYKIQKVVLEWYLAAKLYVRQAPISKQLPHCGFGIGRDATHAACMTSDGLFDWTMVCADRHDPSPGMLRTPPSPTRGYGKRQRLAGKMLR